MAQKTTSASGASSVSEKKELYDTYTDQQKLVFRAAKEALRKYKDYNNSTSSIIINAYDRKTIRGYLQNPGRNEINLLKAANYLYFRSQIFYRIVHWYAGMWDLRCRNIEIPYDFILGLDTDGTKRYNDTVKRLDTYNLQTNLYEVFCRCYLEDVCFFLWIRDDTGAFPFILDPTECKICGRYVNGGLGFQIDMSKWRSKVRQEMIEVIGEPLTSMWKEFQQTNKKYITVPDKYAGCFKFNIEKIDIIHPPLTGILQMCSGLLDTEDYQAIKDELDIFKLILLPMKTISSTKQMNDFEIDPDLFLDYYNQLFEQDQLPKSVTAAPMPGNGEAQVVDFSSSSADKDIDRISNSQKNIFGVSGGGAVLNANMITSTAAFNAWLQAETDFAISSLIGQVDEFANRMLSYDVTDPCTVHHFELSEYTKKDFRDKLLEANQYGFMFRLALGTLYGFSELQTMGSLMFEQSLGLQNLMIYPLQSSFTTTGDTTGTDPITGGRPTSDDSTLTPEGERSRNR